MLNIAFRRKRLWRNKEGLISYQVDQGTGQSPSHSKGGSSKREKPIYNGWTKTVVKGNDWNLMGMEKPKLIQRD